MSRDAESTDDTASDSGAHSTGAPASDGVSNSARNRDQQSFESSDAVDWDVDPALSDGDLSPKASVSITEQETYQILRPTRHKLASYLDEQGYEIVETTWLTPPFAYGAVLRDPMNDDYQYYVAEPDLGPGEEALLSQLERQLRDDLLFRAPSTDDHYSTNGETLHSGSPDEGSEGDGGVPAESFRSEAEQTRSEVLEAAVRNIIAKYNMDVSEPSIRKVLYYLERDWLRYEAIDPLMQDPRIEEISCDGDDIPIFIHHRDYEDLAVNRSFTRDNLRAFVTKLAQRSGKDISIASPLEGASLPDGSRIELSLGGEVTTKGSAFTIRKFKEEPFTPPDLIRSGTFTAEQMAYLWVLFENNMSAVIAGGTASGKTTTLNAALLFLPPKSKLISIEDTRELLPPQMNWIPMVTRTGYTSGETGLTMMDLLRHSLRHRPEYLLVGEVRGEEAHALFQAMNTGHTTYSTLHADSPRGVVNRLENPPMGIERELLSELDVILIQSTAHVDGERVRRVQTVNEVLELDPDTRQISQRPVFEWDEATDTIEQIAESQHLSQLERQGRNPYTELEHRTEILEFLVEKDITAYDDVTAVTQTYLISPERVRSMIEADDLNFATLRRIRKRALNVS